MEYLIVGIIIFVIIRFFGGSSTKGKKIEYWNHKYKCENCDHDRFINEEHLTGKRYDTILAECAKCGYRLNEDGPDKM